MKPIPVSTAKEIADKYEYDQVIIIAREMSTPEKGGGELCTTYGRNPENCTVAAKIGDFIKFKIMKWETGNE